MAYQSFDEQRGDSDSDKKLQAIKLPESLAGKSLLDVGCNAGFFCREALRRGATRVVGVDSNSDVLKDARERVPNAEFLQTSWWNLPQEKFDYILFLSAIHYERDQKRLLRHLQSHMTPEGVLILECGVMRETSKKQFSLVERGDGAFAYPSLPLLLEDLLEDYAVRDMGQSVTQKGDPVPRFVFHCRLLKPTVLLVAGKPGAGKTVLGREFGKLGGRVINLDFHYSELHAQNQSPRSAPFKYLKDNFVPTRIDAFLNKAVAEKKVDWLNKLVLPIVTPDRRLTVVEGYQFTIPEYVDSMKKLLTERGFRVHVLTL